MNILIVDDESSIRITLKKIIRHFYDSVNIYEAWDGFTAGAKLGSKDIDIVLLDINMPGVNGVDTVKFMKNNSRMGNPHIIVITADRDLQVRNELLQNGVEKIIDKPFTIKEIKKVLENFVIG